MACQPLTMVSTPNDKVSINNTIKYETKDKLTSNVEKQYNVLINEDQSLSLSEVSDLHEHLIRDNKAMLTNDENHMTKASKDSLIVEERPMTKSRANKIKKAMRSLVQAMWVETLITMSKISSFMLGMEEEPR